MKVVVIVSLYHKTYLINHFIHHYLKLNANHIIVCIEDSIFNERESLIHNTFNDKNILLHKVTFDWSKKFDANKDTNENNFLEWFQKEYHYSPEDYKVCADVDEFPTYPQDLQHTVRHLAETDAWQVKGRLVDRFGMNYSTPPIDPNVNNNIFNQFPLIDETFSSGCGANINKIVLCQMQVKLGVGRHFSLHYLHYSSKTKKYYRLRKHHKHDLGIIPVHHFKWNQENIRALEDRLNHTSNHLDQYVKELTQELTRLKEKQLNNT